jgi:sugar (pentulose or hexulose) kinase
MWLEAVDLVLQRLREKGTPFERIKGVSGAGQQHGSVYWSRTGEELLGALKPEETLVGQLRTRLTTRTVPIGRTPVRRMSVIASTLHWAGRRSWQALRVARLIM